MCKYLPFIVVGFVLALACVGGMEQAASTESEEQTLESSNELEPDETRTVSIFQKARDSVVYITNIGRRRYNPLASFFVMPDSSEIPQGTGSGFIWDEEGHIVTNFHVINNYSSLMVKLPDHSDWEAEVVGYSPDKDMAVLKINAPKEKLKPLEIGTSSHLQVGQKVLAIGNPFGLDQTLTTGVVSALDRQIKSITNRTITGVIQTDAAINPGNSGGPLLDSKGRLIGINTAIMSPSGSSAGIGFAVPVDTVKKVIPQLIKYHGIIRPGLGVTFLNDQKARSQGIEGLVIWDVPPRSSAAEAGLEGVTPVGWNQYAIGDIIVGIDKWIVRNSDDYMTIMEKYEIGAEVTVHLLRQGKDKDKVTLRLQQEDIR
ncbi:MAG: trypsin-like peptidase domain-containing protein [Planctomycetota bacterium]